MLRRTLTRAASSQRAISKSIALQPRSISSVSPVPIENLDESLKARPKRLLRDWLSIHNTAALDQTLRDFLPAPWIATRSLRRQRDVRDEMFRLPEGHHLVYFNPIVPGSELLPDGTDPLQSPGAPFVRRMWAGGSLQFGTAATQLNLHVNIPRTRSTACVEGIRDVTIKGRPGEEKVIVGIERRIAETIPEPSDAVLREKIWNEDIEDATLQNPAVRVIERRNIIFMRERSDEELRRVREEGAAPPIEKMIKAQHKPDFSHSLTPTATLLFRYSALTFNAHAIHLDKGFCRDIEGHRNLLFHGPLSVTMLLYMLRYQVKRYNRSEVRKHQASERSEDNNHVSLRRIDRIEYRNIAPLYAEEEMKLCGRKLENGKYDLWIQNAKGGIGVTAKAWTTEYEKDVRLPNPNEQQPVAERLSTATDQHTSNTFEIRRMIRSFHPKKDSSQKAAEERPVDI